MNPGDLIATLDLDDPEAVTKAEPYAEGFPELGPPQVYSSGVDHRFKRSLHDARMILAGKLSYWHTAAVLCTVGWGLRNEAARQLGQQLEAFLA